MAQRILIVEDDVALLRMLATAMRGQGYDVQEAVSGADALGAVQRQRPDVILLDVMMPEMDGHEVTRRLRADPVTAAIPIVVLTAKSHMVNRAEAPWDGADDFVTKPVDPAELARRVAAALSRPGVQPGPDEYLAHIAHEALTKLKADIAWIFVADHDAYTLRSACIASAAGEEKGRALMRGVKGGPGEVSFPLAPGISPLCDVVLTGAGWTDMPVGAIGRLPGGEILARGLEAIGALTASAVPLAPQGRGLGVLLLVSRAGTTDPVLAGLIANEAALAIENVRLRGELEQSVSDGHRAQAFYQTLLNTMGDGLVLLDERGRIQYVNRRLMLMLGYEEGQLLGRPLVELMHQDDRPATQAMIGPRRAGGATASFERRILRSSGAPLPVLAVFVPGGSAGGAVGSVLVLTDLSGQKAREAALEKRTRQLAAINHAGRAMASTLDLDAVPQTILQKSVEALGARGGSILLVDEVSGDLVFQAATGPETERLPGVRVPVGHGIVGWVAQHSQPALVPDVGSDGRFYGGIDRTTGLTTTSIIAVPLLVQRRVIGVLELVNKIDGSFDQDDLMLLQTLAQSSAVAIDNARLYRDLRVHAVELGKAYDQLKAGDQLKDELIQNVSHELRTPLTYILSYVELILASELGPLSEAQRQGLEVVRRKCRSLGKVVGDIVTVQKMSVGALQKRPASLRELIDHALKGCSLAAGQASLRVDVEAPADLPSISGDEVRLAQVLDNLLGNAIKFSPHGGRIVVRLDDVGRALRVEVADSGMGIPPDKIGRIFGRFYQVDGSVTRRYGGVGLGLAICKDIIEAHGGEIWAESEPDRGSSFFFTLPKDAVEDAQKGA